MTYIRHGDVNLHPVETLEGELIEHNGSYVLAYGEVSGHRHILTVERPKDLIIKKDNKGNMYFQLLSEGTLTHEEHKTLIVPKGVYRQIAEREVDHFQDSIVRNVID